ncbi:aspartate carbamoyltransferase, regulatory subunit [Methanococcus vannielii SB]|jgi:aspartate carbamoyltransferase regulatory subunit|uniref:Aspartate carbamoyltransferase regulatory chain n=1 Tax=Methanococcus vannielii (strain ATCC 35089 / DSM 1224 / JCM 13029 / OCM 148 / SB) TaxID=406327 RepID=PYRI_METVS|nr:aspartate carbamoyltransferase regulatory subunit [Methanococcus vannielii]A6UPB5.1 RecName: Full=Aspartate carbamoyltransferase regulatory chain [Methanococcus vannielii SB]ABR54337.1 aspartate carbamoyltransferase, regulatory subunit [Methanococcus vannielii SB]
MKVELKVKPIENGTVIDHIESSKALKVYDLLKINESMPVTLALNVSSKKGSLKDILKIEGLALSKADVNKIALVSPNATINIIKDGKVVSKFKVGIPNKIDGIVKCTNPNCITNKEGIKSKFTVEQKDTLKIRCDYCEKFINSIIISR